MTTGERIRQARKSAGLTQAELAHKLGISAAGIAQWENDLRNPKIETIKKIADALGVDAWTLVDPAVAGESAAVELPAGLPDERRAELEQMARDRAQVLAFAKLDGEREQKLLDQIVKDFYLLTGEGQAKAAERIRELTEVPKYQNVNAVALEQYKAEYAARDAARAEPDGTDTEK